MVTGQVEGSNTSFKIDTVAQQTALTPETAVLLARMGGGRPAFEGEAPPAPRARSRSRTPMFLRKSVWGKRTFSDRSPWPT
jgi:hypothetical protein